MCDHVPIPCAVAPIEEALGASAERAQVWAGGGSIPTRRAELRVLYSLVLCLTKFIADT